MGLDEIPTPAQTQAKLYALQMVVAALLVRHIEAVDDGDDEAKELEKIALGSVRKFELRGKNTDAQRDAARALMEAFASDTIHSAAHSVRRRRSS